ncbi:MAG: hypothetical protein PVI71_15770 [Desulfobacterales bacterium]|jgi:hypothetical protein
MRDEPIIQIKVQCYAGYRGEETPRTIWFQSRKIEVNKVLDRWLAPNHRYFKILGDDDGIYIIRHDVNTWVWGLTYYQEAKEVH